MQIKTIAGVISILDKIIAESEKNNNPLGYFAALYQRVTIRVNEGIENQFFDDGKRMEKLDIVFAKRYIDAFFDWQDGKEVTLSWVKTFDLSTNQNILVLQHLLMGMNAHINLDLGIAAAEISDQNNIHSLKNDFNKINEILSSMVDETQSGLSTVWPPLKRILSLMGKLDNHLVDFSMKLARDGAWEFANKLVEYPLKGWSEQIRIRDKKIAKKSKIITEPGKKIQLLLWIIRLGERGSVSKKIASLRELPPNQ